MTQKYDQYFKILTWFGRK